MSERTIKTMKIVLADGEEAVKDEMACVDLSTGEAVAGQASTTILPIGRFMQTMTGDGVKTVQIDLFQEVTCHPWENDSAPNNVVSADRFAEVYIKDSKTVSTSDGGSARSVAGRVIKVEDGLVWVQSGVAVTGPTGPAGAASISALVTELASKVNEPRRVSVNLSSARLADGTPVPEFDDGVADGFEVTGGEAYGIRFNPIGEQTAAVFFDVMLPADIDETADLEVEIMAAKVGATVGDATVFTVGAFLQVEGALYDADSDFGGDSSAMTGNAATKTIQVETATLGAADIPAGPAKLTLSLVPKAGSLGTDDVILLGVTLIVTPVAVE